MRKFLVVLLIVCLSLTIHRLARSLSPLLASNSTVVVALNSTPEPTQRQRTPPSPAAVVTPTIAPFFRTSATTQEQNRIAAIGSTDEEIESIAQDAVAEPVEVAASRPLSYTEVVIYGDELDENWTLAYSYGVQYLPWNTSYWFQPLSRDGSLTSGATTIAVTPEQEYGALIFAVQPNATVNYERNDLLGVSFWLNSGETLIEPDDLAVAVIGSDTESVWTVTQSNVALDGDRIFSETRLYYLEVNRSIPPNTWVNVVVWLDKLVFDPTYTYVTGFYIKNDFDMRSTYYIDQVSLLLAASP